MRIGVNPVTFEKEISLTDDEAKQMVEMVKGASLNHRRTFHKLITELV